jgi:sugar phosphate isomerase/epimerase
MTKLRVNLPVSYVESSREYADLFLAYGLRPEIGLDADTVDRPPEDLHRGVASTFLEAGLGPSVHLPFQDLLPGARDPLVRGATAERLRAAFETARIYEPSYLVGHAVYWEPFYLNDYDKWLENSVATWRQVLAIWPDRPPLYLENVFESDPEPLAELMSALDEPGVGICLDVGHWHSFGGGARKRNLAHWIETLAPWLGHLHLHDNDGTSDHHVGLGKGKVPWAELFTLLEAHGLRPTYTLEPHTKEAFDDSRSFIEANPAWFEDLIAE